MSGDSVPTPGVASAIASGRVCLHGFLSRQSLDERDL